MATPIDPNVLRVAENLGRMSGAEDPKKDNGESFADVLKGLVKETDNLQKTSDGAVSDFAAGKVDDVHDVMLAMTKADLSFRMMLEVRNKLVEAYQEVMRIQV